jgi:hypothetical protein
MHVSLERIGPWPFRAEAVPFLIAVPTVARVTHMVLGMRPLPPGEHDGMPEARGVHSDVVLCWLTLEWTELKT